MRAHAVEPVLDAGAVDLGVQEGGGGELEEEQEGGGGAAWADFGCEAGLGEEGDELGEGGFCFGGFWREGEKGG